MSRAAAELGLRWRGVPVRIGRGGEVGELHGAKAELLVWSARAVELQSYGFHCGQAAVELGQRR